jgi:hypothetical protein
MSPNNSASDKKTALCQENLQCNRAAKQKPNEINDLANWHGNC